MTEDEEETTTELNNLDGMKNKESKRDRWHCSPEQRALNKEYDDGWQQGLDWGRFYEFEKANGIKTVRWTTPSSVNGMTWFLDHKPWDSPLIGKDVSGPLKLEYKAWYIDENGENRTVLLEGDAKNNTIGEVFKGIDELINKYYWSDEEGYAVTDHYWIANIRINDDVLTFDMDS